MKFPASRALDNFILEPIRLRRYGLARYRISQLLHDRTNGRFDAAYLRVAKLLRPKVALPDTAAMTGEQIAEAVALLKDDGFAALPFRLTQREIDELRQFAFSAPAHGRDFAGRIPIRPDAIPADEPRYVWWMQDVAGLPAVRRLIADGPYCQIAQDYLGCRPSLVSISLFLDRPHPDKYTAHTYHYDNEGPVFLKFFFYLTAVDLETGPHHFIRGSHGHTKPPRFARATFYTDEDLLAHYGRDKELVIEGRAGTAFAEDTAGFHRGSSIERDHRLVLQFEFSVMDIPTEDELLRAMKPAAIAGLDPGIARIAGKFYAAGKASGRDGR